MHRLALALASLAAPLGAQDLVTETELLLPTGLDADDQFGFAVDVDGDTLVISARYDEDAGANGTVSIYVDSGAGWVLQQKLGGPAFFGLGSDLDLAGDRLAVSRPAGASGKVDIFTRSGGVWSLETTLQGSAASFGGALELDGERLIVGAGSADSFATDAGAAYVYLRSGGVWHLEQELVSPFVDKNDRFGTSVALDGDLAVVGAPDEPWFSTARPGSAHVFRRSAGVWAFEERLQNIPGDKSFAFGTTVDVEADLIAVGEPGAGLGVGMGAVHVFRGVGTAWSQEAVLTPPDPRTNMQLGQGLALHGGALLTCARYDKTVLLYGHGAGGWQLTAQLVPALPWWTSNENAIAFDGERIVLGNRYEPAGAPQGGAVRVFRRPLAPLASVFCAGDVGLCPCGNESGSDALAGCAHLAGWGAQVAASGSASVAADDLLLYGRAWHKQQPALLYGAPATGAPLPAGDGLLCLGGSLVRLGVDLGDELVWGPGLIGMCGGVPGETWAFQVVLRDPAGPCGAGYTWTQALAITLEP